MGFFKFMNRLQVWAYDIYISIAAVFLGSIILVVLIGIVSRYVFNSPFSWTEEVVTTMMIYLCYSCAAPATIAKTHIAADFLKNLFPKQVNKIVSVVFRMLEVFFFVIVTISAIRCIPSRAYKSPVLHLQRWVLFVPVLASSVVMVVFVILDLFNDLIPGYNYFLDRKKKRDAEAARIEEEEQRKEAAAIDAFMDRIIEEGGEK
jgi:TRAP-type C4-dicarboxylate transport system permease small subunit